MSLLKEIVRLSEEEIETKQVEDLWKENEGSATSYIRTMTYQVRQDPKSKQFEVFYSEDNRRKLYGKLSAEDLKAAFIPVRANQNPDAEGFTIYRDADELDAFKYGSDTIKVNLGAGEDSSENGEVVQLNKGDYVLRQADGNKFIYTVEQGRYFDNDYAKKP